VKTINPCYLTICGINSGVKLVRDRLQTASSNIISSDTEDWFDVQTNADPLMETIPYKETEREEAAIKCMENIKSNLCCSSMLHLVLDQPLINTPDTAFACFFCPKTSELQVLIPTSTGEIQEQKFDIQKDWEVVAN
jgi:hypothetical protein